MASILLGTLATATGSAVGASPILGLVTSQLTQLAGSAVTGALTGKPNKRHIEGARLEELAVQTSTYGRAIPSFFGTVRLAGNVIWSLPIKEVVTTSTVQSGGKGGGGSRKQTVSQTSYSYFVTLAIAIGEGPITRIDRVWADAKLLDLSLGTYRIYTGTEMQLPDSMIESYEGVGKTPAYRGMAYVVIEDFPLASFGNRIPNFSFEVTRSAVLRAPGEVALEEHIRSVVLLPGSGEYVYDTVIAQKSDGVDVDGSWAAQGYRKIINANTAAGKADVLVAIDQMLDALPNLEWVSLVVNWFGTTTDIASCELMPCVEYQTATQVTPYAWSVAGYSRSSARLIGFEDGRPRYGGTPDDGSIVRLAAHLKSRGLKLFFYPMMLMDVAGKPWRGHLGGSAANVANFFTRTNGYNRYILHYANLLKNKVDAFAIGSEMRTLNAITASTGVFPAVSQFISLAAQVKTIMGSATKITYAADWSEYHHTDGGWYNLDPLWASANIDMIGIDAYFPLTDVEERSITRQSIEGGWTSGEGYDWYYADEARTDQQPLAAAYAWKNIDWWWRHTHTNPDTLTSAWVPESKPIWFTEIGYASVDGCTNEPNVFIDPSSSETGYPRFSRERVDFPAQRRALEVAHDVWAASDMVEEMFVWAWDARPYPAWPDLLNVWSDGGNWVTGHWIQGKIGRTQLDAIVKHLLLQVGIAPERIELSALKAQVDGIVLHQRTTARAMLEQLQTAYGFDLKESGGRIVAVTRNQESIKDIVVDVLVPFEGDSPGTLVEYTRTEESELPKRLEVRFLDRFEDYGTSVQAATRDTVTAVDTETISLSLVLSETTAKLLAERKLYERWLGRERWQFQLPVAYAYLEVGDVITLIDSAFSVPLLITKLQLGRPGLLRIEGVLHQRSIYDHYIAPVVRGGEEAQPLLPTLFAIMDVPTLPSESLSEHSIKCAMVGTQPNWPGGVLLRDNGSGGRDVMLSHNVAAVMGTAISVLPPAPEGNVFDYVSHVDLVLLGSASVSNVSNADLLRGANAALLGNEIIQFGDVEILSDQQVRVSRLLRARLGTQWATGTHAASEPFVLLNESLRTVPLSSQDIGQTIGWHMVTVGLTELEATAQPALYQARALMPYAPVHVMARQLSSGDIVCQWKRCTRGQGEWRDGVDVPLNEASERYGLEVWSGTTRVHMTEVSSPNYTYTQSQQIADAGSILSTTTLKIWQISDIVGKGYIAANIFSF